MSTYTPISSFTATTSISSVTIAGIPQNYTDLVLTMNFALSGNNEVLIRFNGDSTSALYSRTFMEGNGSAASSSRTTGANQINILGRNSQMTNIINVMNYANTTTFKNVLARFSSPSEIVGTEVGLWRNTSAISSITFDLSAGTFNSGTVINLYGVDASLSAQAKATGGSSITTDGTYWYHTFLSSGTFTPTAALTADYLVVAGGGGGGKHQGGGGGAGGLRSTVTATGGGGSLETALSLLSGTGYTVTIGAGGAGTSTGNTAGLAGSNSVFSTITSTAGGGGGYYNTNTATSGGSGGGAPGGATAKTAGTGTANQGYAGGVGCTDSTGNGGGGGGAGAVGGTAVNGSSAGNGGIGVAISSFASATGTGVSNYYAGGGGGGRQNNGSSGGSGGSGGGGNGAQGDNQTAGSGVANTGGGGGGETQNNGTSGNGGSGIVIIRYAV